MSFKKQINLLGYNCGIGAQDSRCSKGFDYYIDSTEISELQESLEIEVHTGTSGIYNIKDTKNLTQENKLSIIFDNCEDLAHDVIDSLNKRERFISLGGDHSMAIGTWSGVTKSIGNNFGLIWIDAHIDSHTPETSHSNNIHGMPLATLLGYGHSKLVNLLDNTPKINPENLCIIGVRSYEPEEIALVEQLGIKYIKCSEIDLNKDDIDKEIKIALDTLKNTEYFGISIDLDVFDPKYAPGTGCRVPGGLRPEHIINSSYLIKEQQVYNKFVGLEIAEFNPSLDEDNKTNSLITNLIKTFF